MKNLTKKFLALAVVTTALFNAPQASAQSTTASNVLSGISTAPTQYLGSSNTFDVITKSNNVERMRITTGGNIGIGIATPANRLHIAAPTTSAPQLRLSDATGSWQLWGSGNFRVRDGANNDRLFIQANTGNVGIGSVIPDARLEVVDSNPSIQVQSSAAISGTLEMAVAGCNTCFSTQSKASDGVIRLMGGGDLLLHMPTSGMGNQSVRINSTYKEIFSVWDNGVVAIGGDLNIKYQQSNLSLPLISAANYQLVVEKGILAEKVKVAVKNTANWADYVFANDYKLKPLAEVEAFVKTNKHLPGVPSAEDVVKDGIDMATMDAKLLEKVEELTLYLIDLKKEVDVLKAENNQLKTAIATPTKQ